jgi:hypothetical protein
MNERGKAGRGQPARRGLVETLKDREEPEEKGEAGRMFSAE